MPDKLRKLAEHLQREGHMDNETDALLAAMYVRLAVTAVEDHRALVSDDIPPSDNSGSTLGHDQYG